MALLANGYYLSIGSGSHGYLPSPKSKIGIRYFYDRSDRSFIKSILDRSQITDIISDVDCNVKGITRDVRDDKVGYEYIGSSLRSQKVAI